jgi:type IV pilus assembly protein PilX
MFKKTPHDACLPVCKHYKSHQQGVALVMVLLFLVAITGITVWAARQSTLGEGMSRNQQDLEVARQAAESAIRDAERDLKGVTPTSQSTPSCSRNGAIMPVQFRQTCPQGLCIRTDEADYAKSNWSTATKGSTANTEPWWPIGKGGLWGEETTNNPKPIRIPATANSNCTFTGGIPLGTYTGAPAIRGVSTQPEYLIEYFHRSIPGRKEISVYRITARGFGYSTRTQVVLQSIFLPD